MVVYHDFFCYPDQSFLKWIRIRPNDTDPTGSGSGTLSSAIKKTRKYFRFMISSHIFCPHALFPCFTWPFEILPFLLI